MKKKLVYILLQHKHFAETKKNIKNKDFIENGKRIWLILDPTKSELTCIAHLLQIRNIYIDYEC